MAQRTFTLQAFAFRTMDHKIKISIGITLLLPQPKWCAWHPKEYTHQQVVAMYTMYEMHKQTQTTLFAKAVIGVSLDACSGHALTVPP